MQSLGLILLTLDLGKRVPCTCFRVPSAAGDCELVPDPPTCAELSFGKQSLLPEEVTHHLVPVPVVFNAVLDRTLCLTYS